MIDKKQVITKEFVEQFINTQADKYKQTRLFKMVIPFDSISSVHYHVSEADPGLAMLALELAQVPSFAQTAVTTPAWQVRADFTSKQQAVKESKHFVIGYHEEFEKILALLLTDAVFAAKYKTGMSDAAKRTKFATTTTTDVSLPNDEPFNKTQIEGKQDCCIM